MSAPRENRTVLYVSGFSVNLRARDLAYEFERFGRLVRCDIPALKTPSSAPFAFVEFRHPYDAEDAYYDMHGRSIDGYRVMVQWAKRPPSSGWRHEAGGPRGPPPRGYDDRRDDRRVVRSPSPPRRDDRDRHRSASPAPKAGSGSRSGGDVDMDRDGRDDQQGRDRSRSRSRSRSPAARKENGSGGRTGNGHAERDEGEGEERGSPVRAQRDD